MKRVLLSAVLALSVLLTFGQEPDSLKANKTIEENYLRNLEEMTNLWYVRNTPQIDSVDYSFTPKNSDIVSFSDSVYLERLKNIPSAIDLSYNRFVKSYIKVYTEKKRPEVEKMLGLTQYYFPIFEEILDQYNLPQELKYLPIIESALNPKATSRVGAAGLWQFMYGTGKMYKLEINSFVDERRDPVKSSHAAAQFIQDLYRMYDDWILVIAAYNCGPGNVNKAIRRSGGKKNYWEMYYYLPRETRGYVPAFIAATYFMNYYKEHNLAPQQIDYPYVTDTLEIKEELHLKQVAEVLNIPVQYLRDLNPQYRYDIIPAKNKSYFLNIPYEYSGHFISNQDSIFKYKDKEFFDPSKIIIKPNSNYSYKTPQPANTSAVYYKVKEGDNLGFIADWYDVGLSQVRSWNGIRRNLIRVGQKLVIYVPKSKVDYYNAINTMSFSQKQIRNGKQVSATTSSIQNKPTPVENSTNDADFEVYKVRRGDTLWDIAKKYPGVSATDIKRLNNLSENDKIVPGQYLKIKVKS